MLRLANKSRYALQALSDIAFHHGQDAGGDRAEPAQIKDIAIRQRIPMRFLEQIFQDLKRAGLVGAKRGPRGGYRLARPAKDIAVGDVLRATSGSISGFTASKKKPKAEKDLRDITDRILGDLARSLEECLDKVTLQDVVTRGEELGLRRKTRPTASYAI
jgi:Rrf2 family protein